MNRLKQFTDNKDTDLVVTTEILLTPNYRKFIRLLRTPEQYSKPNP